MGNFSANSFPCLRLHPELLAASIKAANNALTVKTWAGYDVIKSHLRKCQQVTGCRFSFPMADHEIVTLIAYLLAKTNLKAVSISKYMSGLRYIERN